MTCLATPVQLSPMPTMKAATAVSPVAAPAAGRALRLSPSIAFYLLASLTITFLAGSSAPTPLYSVYRTEWGFTPLTVTLIFGIYALAVLSALLVAGRLSDHLGRRPVLITAALVQSVAMLVFATADGVASLMVARVIQGLATGSALAAIGAGMLDLDTARGTLANSVAPSLGTGLGGLVAGLVAHFLPAPTHLVYLIFAVTFVAQAVGVVFIAETASQQAGAGLSLRPQFRVPAAVRGPMLLAVPILLAAWSIGGLYASLVPALLHAAFGWDASLQGGIALFLMAVSGTGAILLLRGIPAGVMVKAGASALLVGAAGVVAALACRSATGFLLGTIVVGAGFGIGFQGGMRSVVTVAAPQERAGVLSVIFVVSYLALALPVIVAGMVVVRSGNLLGTAEGFGLVVIALAAIALVGAVLNDRPALATR